MGVSMKEVFVKMSMDMGDLKRGFDNFQKQTTTAENKTKSLDGQMNKFAGTIKKLAITVGAGLMFKKLIDSTTVYEEKIQNLNTLLPGQTTIIKDLEQGFLDLAGPLGSTSELAGAAYDALSGGVEPGESVEFVGQAAMFAKANLIDLKDSVDVLTTIMNTYGDSAGTAAEITDTLTTVVRLGKTHGQELAATMGDIAGTAATVGISFDDLAVSLIGTTAGGINTSKSMTSLKAIVANIAKPTAEAKKVAKDLGIEFNLAGIKSKGWAGFLLDLTEKVKGDTQAQTNLFGSVEAFNAIAVLTSEKGLAKMAEGQEALRNKANATKEAYDKQQKTFSASLKAIKNEVEAILIKAVLPVFQDLAETMKDPAFKEGLMSIASAMASLTKYTLEFLSNIPRAIGYIAEVLEQNEKISASEEEHEERIFRLSKKWDMYVSSLEKAVREGKKFSDKEGQEILWALEDIDKELTYSSEDRLPLYGRIFKTIADDSTEWGKLLKSSWDEYTAGIKENALRQRRTAGDIRKTTKAMKDQDDGAGGAAKGIIPFSKAIKDLQDKAKEGTLKINDLTGAYDRYYPEVIASEKKTKEFLDVLDDLRKDVAPDAAIQLDAIRASLMEAKKPAKDLTGALIDGKITLKQYNEWLAKLDENTDSFLDELKDSTVPMENFGDEVSYTAGMSKKLNDEMLNSIDAFGDMPKTISGVKKRMQELRDKYRESKVSQAEFEAGMAALEAQLKSLEGWALVLGTALGKLESVMSSITGIDFSSPMGALSSIAEKILTTIGETDWEKYGQAMGKSLGISSEMANKLGALSKEMEGVNGALFTMMDEIISDENISNIEDFNKWLAEIARMMPAVAANETPIRELEEAFSALLASSGDIGYLGQAFHEIAGNAAEFGFELESINSFMENEMIAGTDGYRAAIEANFTDAILPVFQEQIALQDRIADNKPLVDGVEGWGRAIIAFGNLNKKVLQTDMDGFIKGTLDGYDDLIEKAGFSVPQALELIAPQLGTLIALAQDHSLVLDDNIQSLIDLADENNISVERRKTAEEQMVDLLEELVDILRGDLPAAMEDFANEAVGQFGKVRTSINDATGELSTFLDTIPDSVGMTADFGHMGGPVMGEIPGFQAGTGGVFVPTPRQFTVGEGGAERVEMRRGSMRVTPLENEAGASGNVTNVNINIQSMDSRGVYEVTRDQIVPLIYEFSKKGGVTIDRRAVI